MKVPRFSVLRISTCFKWHNKTLPKNKIFSSPKDSDLKIKVSWFVNPSWFLEVLNDEGTSIFSVKNFYVFQMTQQNTP